MSDHKLESACNYWDNQATNLIRPCQQEIPNYIFFTIPLGSAVAKHFKFSLIFVASLVSWKLKKIAMQTSQKILQYVDSYINSIMLQNWNQNLFCSAIFHIVWKSPIISHLIFFFKFNYVCPIIGDLSGNTVWLQASVFFKNSQK